LVLSPRGSGRRGLRRIEGRGRRVEIDASATLVLPATPRRWIAATSAEELRAQVVAGRAAEGPVGTHRDRRGALHAALLFAVPHRVTWRSALVLGRAGAAEPVVDLLTLPQPLDVVRGWDRALDRGLHVELPDQQEQDRVHLSRATLLLGAERAGRDSVELSGALQSWGFEREAERVGRRSSRRARRRAARDRFGHVGTDPVGAACVQLGALRSMLVTEHDDGIDLLPGFPVEWLGLPIAVRDLPTRHGLVSFALRWHAERPALLWNAPPRVRMRAPTLDATWESLGGTGEALLAAPQPQLLDLRSTSARVGEHLDEPGSFV
jgi:hypothetical protein